jgi:O-antigen ligase
VVAAVVGVAVGLSLLSGAARLGVQGRLGELSLSFYVAHFRTLLGEAGPGAGTIVGRANWWTATADEWQSSLPSALFGVGLGPDLASGFRLTGDIFVRKPHNDYLEILARTGIVGLGLFLWLVGVLVVPLGMAARRSSHLEGRFCAWVLATSVCYFGIANTQPLLAFPYGAVPLFFFLGAGLAVAEPVIADSAHLRGALSAEPVRPMPARRPAFPAIRSVTGAD